VQKGILHALFLGVFDYTKAKKTAPVQAIAKRLKMDAFEKFLLRNSNLGLVIMTSINLVVFGFKFGLIISCCNFLISPIFAVGGVNALAHWAGYRNHKSSDNSRNLGFLLPLNFIICGELDHNNHHAQQKSCSFRHQWYEFDIGYVYIKIFSFLGLAKIKNVYTLQNMNQDMISQAKYIIENNLSIQQQFDSISRESDIHVNELKEKVYAYLEDRGVSIERSLHELSLNIIKLIHHTRYQATC
jgi:fatty-acid desaturase